MAEALRAVRTVYEASTLRRVFAAVGRIWRASGVYALLLGLLSAPCLDEGSAIRAWFGRCNARLSGAARLNAALDRCALRRGWRAVRRVGEGSWLLGPAFREGVTGVMLLLLALYTPLDHILRDVFTIPVLSSGWDEGLLILALGWVVLLRVRERPPRPAAATPLDLPVAAFLLTCVALFAVRMRLVEINIAGLRATAQYILWFFLATRLLRNDRQFDLVYYVLVGFAALISLHGIYQFIVAAPIPAHWVDQAETAVRTRVYSIFGSPNIMGDFMVMFAPMAAALAYTRKRRVEQIICWLATFTMCFSCLFTMSRGAWIALVAAIFVFALLVDRRLIALMAAAFVVALFLPFVASRIGYLFTDAYAESSARGGRAVRWAQALVYLKASDPVFGIGFGMFGGAVAMQNPVSSWMQYFYTDNYYVKILAENGYVGLVSFCVMMLGVLWTGVRGWFSQRHGTNAPLCAGMLASLTGVLVHCYFENIFEEPYMAVTFWTIAALLIYQTHLRPRLGISNPTP